ERRGGFLSCHALQVAEHERGAELVRQTLHLVVENLTQVLPVRLAVALAGRHVRYRLLAGAPPGGLSPRLLGDARGHAVQPVAKPFGLADRAGPARPHQERRPEGVPGRPAGAPPAAAP